MRDPHDDGPNRCDPEFDSLWAQEAERRIDAYEQGRLKAVSLENVLDKYGRSGQASRFLTDDR